MAKVGLEQSGLVQLRQQDKQPAGSRDGAQHEFKHLVSVLALPVIVNEDGDVSGPADDGQSQYGVAPNAPYEHRRSVHDHKPPRAT
jgi:hypothetical protein